MSKRGQADSIITIILIFFVASIILFQLLPTITNIGESAISDISGTPNADITSTVIRLFPFMLVLVLIVALVLQGTGQRRQGVGGF